jgi:flagellar basal-body rod protein FlgF
MDPATYATATAGILQMRKLEVQSNNLANINTVGFKGQFIVPEKQDFDDTLAHMLGFDSGSSVTTDPSQVEGVGAVEAQTDFSLGPIHNTANPLDVALRSANEFFVVNTPDGPLYTRAGNFTLNQNGDLVTSDGFPVQGDGGTINVTGPDVSISSDGSVRSLGQTFGRLQVVKFEKTDTLERVAGARFRIKDGGAQPTQVASAVLEPRALEMSNVSAITGMIDLIQTNRAFEAYTKAAQTIDQLNQISTTKLAS